MIDKFDPEIYHTKSNLIVKIIIAMMVRVMFKMLDLKHKDLMIELGCGAGNILGKIPSVKNLIGMDISQKLLKRASIRGGNKIKLIAGDAEVLPFQNNSFDKILCTEVIEHLLFPGKCLSEIQRIAKDKAIIVITTTNEDFLNKVKSLAWKIGMQKLLFRGNGYKPKKRMDDEWHLHAFNPQKFSRLLNKYFNIVKVSFVPSYILPVQIIVKCTKK